MSTDTRPPHSIENEGSDVAKWPQARGVAAFMLKHRSVHMAGAGDPVQKIMALMTEHRKLDEISAPVVPLAIADGKKAIEYVRGHVKELGVRADKVRIMGSRPRAL